MTLIDNVRVARRFQRAVRIDADASDPKALEGFICPESSSSVLTSMAHHVTETGHGAFTWTGPYGSGKSSLVVVLSALLGLNKRLRELAEKVVGKRVARTISTAMPQKSKGWCVLPVVGRREHPAQVIGEAMKEAGIGFKRRPKVWSEEKVVTALVDAAKANPRSTGGVILFVDEMGKFLEGAASEGTDLYLFQLLAEAASRSDGRLVLVGVLHQAFGEYANRLTHEMRDEWSKIQGRFVDLAVNPAGEEQIELIARAIESDQAFSRPGLVKAVGKEIKRLQPSASEALPKVLENCWPLHPVTACLLGPISRRRFGQNQRSIFGFLNSAEPHGFQEFLQQASAKSLYEPDMLWDYLRANLEPSIIASSDGHRWALAVEVIERCEALSSDALPIRLLKCIAVIDLFRERSGISANEKILEQCLTDATKKDVGAALNQLGAWSLIVFRGFNNSYAVYAGSDFDIEAALREALEKVAEMDFHRLGQIAGLQPILAKRHYHDTGALRWFDVDVVPVSSLSELAEHYQPKNGVIGQFVLAIPNEGESEDAVNNACRSACKSSDDWDLVIGASVQSWNITNLLREVIALEDMQDENPDLAHDPVARREVLGRYTSLQSQLEDELRDALDKAVWHAKHLPRRLLPQSELSVLASRLADRRFPESPVLHNELLNRIKPSANATGALNSLLRLMVSREGVERLGIEGFPAEGGLFDSLLSATGLYSKVRGEWRFWPPVGKRDCCKLSPLWEKAEQLLIDAGDQTLKVSEIYDDWRRKPFGVRDGVMPILAVAFILSRRDTIALYREGVFQPRFKDIDIDVLTNNPADIQLRWMNLSDFSRRILSSMAQVVRDIDKENTLVDLAPIDVARGLIAIFDRLHPWVLRTTRVSSNANRIRDLFKRANDPNKFLFDDIPDLIDDSSGELNEEASEQIVSSVREGLDELVQAYPEMLSRLRDMMLAELQVPNASPSSLAELRARAENIRQLGGDFQLDAFIGRVGTFEGSQDDIEGIASLAARKPPRDWVDADLDRAALEITAMAEQFVRAETFVRVKGRTAKRQSMAVIVGKEGRPVPVHEEFSIGDADRLAVDALVKQIHEAISTIDSNKRNVILAAIAEVGSDYIHPTDGKGEKQRKRVAK